VQRSPSASTWQSPCACAALTLVSHCKKAMHRGWASVEAQLAFTLAAFHGLVQWYGLRPNALGFVPLSTAELSLYDTHTIGYSSPRLPDGGR
jgi:hypothetical protein